MPEQH